MSLIGNILWLFLGGIASGLMWLVSGFLWCITIVGIPYGRQCFKFAALSFCPYMAEARFLSSPILYGSCFWHRNGNCKFIDGASALHNDNRHSIWQEVFQDYETGVNAIWRKSKILFPTGIRCFSSV